MGHSILTSIQRCRQAVWKQCEQGATMRPAGRITSTGFMQITHSTDPCADEQHASSAVSGLSTHLQRES